MRDDVIPLFQDEIQLVAWGDSNTQGPWIKLRLREPEQLNVFRGLTQAKGDRAGQRIAVVMVLIGDDEKPEPPPAETENPGAKPLGGPLARLAGLWCGDRRFQVWVMTTFHQHIDGHDLTDEQLAAEAVRLVCGVKSRAELDHNHDAAEKFHALIRMPYSEYLSRVS